MTSCTLVGLGTDERKILLRNCWNSAFPICFLHSSATSGNNPCVSIVRNSVTSEKFGKCSLQYRIISETKSSQDGKPACIERPAPITAKTSPSENASRRSFGNRVIFGCMLTFGKRSEERRVGKEWR